MSSETNTLLPARRSERLVARVSADQKRLLLHAAALEGRTLSDFLVTSAQEAAQRTIRDHEVITLGVRDSEAFVKALLNPTPINDRLRETLRLHSRRSRQGGSG